MTRRKTVAWSSPINELVFLTSSASSSSRNTLAFIKEICIQPQLRAILFCVHLLFRPARRFEVAEGIVRIVCRVGERVAVVEKTFHQLDGNRKSEALAEGDLHVRHAHDFAGEIEERAAAVAGIDLRAGLQIQFALKLARLGAQNALRDGAFEAERTADGKHAVADIERIRAAERDGLELRRVLVLDVQQRKVVKFIDGDDLDLLVSLAVKLAAGLMINLHGNFRLALDDVEIGDEIAVVVDEKTGAKSAGRFHLHHGLANLLDK